MWPSASPPRPRPPQPRRRVRGGQVGGRGDRRAALQRAAGVGTRPCRPRWYRSYARRAARALPPGPSAAARAASGRPTCDARRATAGVVVAGGVSAAAAAVVATAVAPPPPATRGGAVQGLLNCWRRWWRRWLRSAAPPASTLAGPRGWQARQDWRQRCAAAAARRSGRHNRALRRRRRRCCCCRRRTGRGGSAARRRPPFGGGPRRVAAFPRRRQVVAKPPLVPFTLGCLLRHLGAQEQWGVGEGWGFDGTAASAVPHRHHPSGLRLCPARPTRRPRSSGEWASGWAVVRLCAACWRVAGGGKPRRPLRRVAAPAAFCFSRCLRLLGGPPTWRACLEGGDPSRSAPPLRAGRQEMWWWRWLNSRCSMHLWTRRGQSGGEGGRRWGGRSAAGRNTAMERVGELPRRVAGGVGADDGGCIAGGMGPGYSLAEGMLFVGKATVCSFSCIYMPRRGTRKTEHYRLG